MHIYGRIKLFMGGSNFLWADAISLTEFIYIMEKPLLKLVGVAFCPGDCLPRIHSQIHSLVEKSAPTFHHEGDLMAQG
jgi:hypothetical protein